MQLRGINFLPIDLYTSAATAFTIASPGKIRPPLNAIPGISPAIAEAIVAARADGPFLSRDELARRAAIGQSAIATLASAGCLDGLPESAQIDLVFPAVLRPEAMFCRVVLKEATRAFDREFTYAVPPSLETSLSSGSWVEIPFGNGNRLVQAFVLSLESESGTDFHVKPVQRLLSDRPVLRRDQLQLSGLMRQRYGCTYGDALRLMVPSAVAAVGDKLVRMAELPDPAEAARRLNDGEIDRIGHQRVIEMLLEYGAVPVPELMHACQISRAVLKTLEKKDLIRYFKQEVRRSGGEEAEYETVSDFVPNDGQREAIARIQAALTASGDEKQLAEFVLLVSPAAARPRFTSRPPAWPPSSAVV